MGEVVMTGVGVGVGVGVGGVGGIGVEKLKLKKYVGSPIQPSVVEPGLKCTLVAGTPTGKVMTLFATVAGLPYNTLTLL